MTEEVKNSPIEDFDWEAYENGETAGVKTREELTSVYDESPVSYTHLTLPTNSLV